MAGKTTWDAAAVKADAVSLADLLTKEFGVKVDGPFDIGTESITTEPRSQVRAKGGVEVDPKLVEEYVQQLKSGAIFPPGVLNQNRWVIDCNTRLAAAKKLGLKTIPVIIVTTVNPTMDRLIGGFLNQRGAARLKPVEVATLARELAEEGMSAVHISKRLGISASKVNRILKAVNTEHRAESLGIPFNGGFAAKEDTKVALAGIRSDPAFKEVVKLTEEAALAPKDVRAIVREFPETGDDETYLGIVNQKRTEYTERIAQVAAGVLQPKPSPWTRLKMHLGALATIDPDGLPPITDKAVAGENIERINEVVELLTTVRDGLRESASVS